MSHYSESNNVQLIVSLCESISKKGVTPTVGLIKSQANRPLSLPEIVSVLKIWKQDPNHYQNSKTAPTNTIESPVKTADDIIKSLEQRVDRLEQQMVTLLKLQE